MSDDVCGSTDTSSGDPCQFSPADSCPWHNEDKNPDSRNTELEDDHSIVDLVAGQLQNGDTVPEACAEANISEDQYYSWRRRGLEDDGIFAKFRKETARARKTAGKRDRERLRRECKENGDTRTWFKLHMNQYGDTYGDEDTDMRDGTEIVLHESEDTYTAALEN